MRGRPSSPTLCAALLPVMILAAMTGPAAGREDAAGAVLACIGIADAGERLACFDRTAPGLRPDAGPVQGLGAEQLPRSRSAAEGEGPAEALSARVAKLSPDPDRPNRLLITLDNGQVWVQRESKSFDLAPGDLVTIKPAFLGTYTLVREGSRAILKVRRVQ